MYIKKNKKSSDVDSNSKTIKFRDILAVSKLKTLEEEKYILKTDCEGIWTYVFFLETSDRKFQLYASSEYERTMWICAFEYITEIKAHE